MNVSNDKIINFQDAIDFFRDIKSTGKSIALCHGVFDLLHPGHLRHLAKARELADIVVVSITADKFVNKGPGRPAFNENLRSESLTNLISVDYVVITPYETAIEIIKSVKPNFYIKGNDYTNEKSDPTGNIIREREVVESTGGKLIYTDEVVFSSSNLINRFLPSHSNEVNTWLKEIKKKYTLDEVLDWLNKISKLKVAVVGEAIIDIYTECEALGKSSKDPVLCFNKGPSEAFAGGILAIGANCHGLGLETTVVTGFNKDDAFSATIENLQTRGLLIKSINTNPFPTIKKERFVDSRTSMRVFELYEMEDKPLTIKQENDFTELILKNIENKDVVIIADYGHGLLTDRVIDTLSETNAYLAINTQTNAGNRGFNSIGRYRKADFVTLNGGEAQLETRRRHVEISSFVEDLMKKMNTNLLIITKGGSGIDIYDSKNPVQNYPALAPYIKDRVGAGDLVLVITSLLSAVSAPLEIIGLYANIVGAWAVTFTGNEKNIDTGTITKLVKSIMA
jgi:rfaE bifunctional protein nucleotidyltransferase chain/domain